MNTLRMAFFFLSTVLVAAPAPAPSPTPIPTTAPTAAPVAARTGFDFETLRLLPIQDRGRVKPFGVFAEESLLFASGKRSWKGMDSADVVFGWLAAYDAQWENEPFLLVNYEPLRKEAGLEIGRRHFSPRELRSNTQLASITRAALRKEQRKEPLETLEKKVLELHNQRALIEMVSSGQAFTILPNPKGVDESWLPLTALTDFSAVNVYGQTGAETLSKTFRAMVESYLQGNAEGWKNASAQLRTDFEAVAKEVYPPLSQTKREWGYQKLRPFRWAWVTYLCAFLLFLVAQVTGKAAFRQGAISAVVAGLILHSYGFILRCVISGRPPVTNMYESVIWVSWGCIVFSLILAAIYRNYLVAVAASAFSIVALVLADNLPGVLDPGIHPLEPVLRSNFWLTIHVLTITLSYAAFAVSLCLGNVVLGLFWFGKKREAEARQYSLYMYRAVQIGVVLLAAGTILGGVWADYSWGRFWGWDPKEVWALIALLLYLAVLHGRYSGWLKGFGFVAATVISFLGVLMAWYGVNFVLGVGLHSYGFGAGGMGYVSAYVAAQLAFIVLAHRRSQR